MNPSLLSIFLGITLLSPPPADAQLTVPGSNAPLPCNASRLWSFATGAQVHSSPAVGDDGTVYVGSFDRELHAVTPEGQLKWSFATGDPVYSSPAVGDDVVESSPAVGDDGTVYVGSDDHKLYAVTPEGQLKWSFATGDEVHSSPAVGDDGTVYVGTRDSKLYAVTPEGQLKWSFATGSYVGPKGVQAQRVSRRKGCPGLKGGVQACAVRSSPAVGDDGTVYVGSDDHKLYAVTPEGQLKWSFATGDRVQSSPAVGDDGTVYVGSYDGKLYAVVYPVCGGCAATELRLCGPARTDPWTCLTCMTAYEAPLRLAGCGIANASDFCSHTFTPCALALGRLCAGAKTNSSFECSLCCGEHQQALREANCTSRDFQAFCA